MYKKHITELIAELLDSLVIMYHSTNDNAEKLALESRIRFVTLVLEEQTA